MLAKEERHIGIAVWQHLGQRCEQGIKGPRLVSSLQPVSYNCGDPN